jgi:hypothetical protein
MWKNFTPFISLMLFKNQFALLVQLRCMSSKYVPISLNGEGHVSSPYLAQIDYRSTNQTKFLIWTFGVRCDHR